VNTYVGITDLDWFRFLSSRPGTWAHGDELAEVVAQIRAQHEQAT
jgi:hypothetical protein